MGKTSWKRGENRIKRRKKAREWGIKNGYPRSLPISEGIETFNQSNSVFISPHPRSLPISEGIET